MLGSRGRANSQASRDLLEDKNVAITICGDGGCGKSSITLRLVRSQWTNEYDPTIEDSYSVTRTVDGTNYHLNLTDTAGQEEYRGLFGAATLTSADAFLLVYDITSPNSLETLSHFTQLIDIETEQRMDRGGVPPAKIVVGNKCDLKEERRVSAKEGMDWAKRHGCGFMETSARECVNVEETFTHLVRRVAQARHIVATGGNVFSSSHGQGPHSSNRTMPLSPLNEKGDPIYGRSDAGSYGSRKSIWRKMFCMA